MGGFTCFTRGVAPRSRRVQGNVWSQLFLSSFKVLYVDIMFTKESGHLYWVSMWEQNPAHCSNIPPFIKRRLKIIQVAVWRYI